MRKVLIFLLFIVLGIGVLFLTVNRGQEKYAVAEEREVKITVYGSGYARNKEHVLLKSEVSGYVKEIFVEEGDHVKRGQVVALLDSGSLDASLREVSERLNLVRERAREGSYYLKSLEKSVESARINMENARRVFERREKLFSEGLIPRETYEQSRAQFEIAQKEYERAKSTFEDASKTIRNEEKVLAAERDRLSKEREKYTVRSPIEGYVLKKYISVGDYINHMSQENRLFSIGSEGWEVWLDVDEEYAGLIREGQRVILKVDAFPGKSFEGRVLQIVREVDRSRKLLTVKVQADLPKDTPSGTTVDGQIEVETRKALLVPAVALTEGHVLVYDGVRRVRVKVQTGRRFGDFIEITSGLKAGDRVILP